MSFFVYASFADMFVDNTWWVVFLVGGLGFAIVTVFQGIGLYTIASREGYSHKWMAFLPFFNTYYTGVCAQKNKCFNINAKVISLIAAIYEVLLFALYTLWYCADVILSEGGYIRLQDDFYHPYFLYPVPEYLKWAEWCFNYLFDMNLLLYAYYLFILLEIMLYSAFFQTYACRRYFFFTLSGAIFSLVFPIYGILTYAVRNNKGMVYKDFLRREQEAQYRAYQQFYRDNPANPYDSNPYSRSGSGNPPPREESKPNRGNPPDDPFSEFGNPDDPFEN